MKSGSWSLLVDKINSMVALRIAVFWSVLRDSLPNSKKFVKMESVLSNSLLSRLRKVLKRVLLSFANKELEEKMNCRFNFVTTITWRINRILKTVFKFMLTLVTQAQTKSRHKFYAFRIMRVIHRIQGWSYELQDVFLKNKQIPRIAKISI